MAFWPFGRKKRKTSNTDQSTMVASKNRPPDHTRRYPGHEITDHEPPTLGRKPSRKESQRSRKRGSSRKLTKAHQPRVRESNQAEHQATGPPPLPSALDTRNVLSKKGLLETTGTTDRELSTSPPDRGDVPSYYFQNPTSTSSIQLERFIAMPRVPTLKSKRSANDTNLSRRKSNKRKADDYARELEIKAMSSPIPVPRSSSNQAGGMLARDSKRIPGGLNRKLERPISDISLPQPESLHSTMSVVSDQHGFKISAFDALSPRPTIRYAVNPRYAVASSSLGPSRTSTRKEKQPINREEALRSKKRIDDLADDLDAGSLRELMERDRRRTERVRRSDQERLQRKLQSKAEKQQAEESAATDASDEQGASRGDVGLGIGGATAMEAVENTSVEHSREQDTQTPESWLKDPSREHLPLNDPFSDPITSTGTSHLEEPTPIEEPDEPVLETAKAVRLSQASMSPPTSPTQLMHEPPSLLQLAGTASRSTPDIPKRIESDRRGSDTSGGLSSNWTAIFRRSGTKGKRGSADRGRKPPSEFSNTSRESMARAMPPSAFLRISQARSRTPVHTQSKFREDLPELPISPPDSRVQSPEASVQTQPHPGDDGGPVALGINRNPGQPLSDIHPAFREEVALSRHQSLTSHSPEGLSSGLLSQSLASVDSEGSWLTGRPVKRSSHPQVNPLRASETSFQQRLQDPDGSQDDLELEEDENDYMDRLTPSSDEGDVVPGHSGKPPHIVAGSGTAGDSDEDTGLPLAPLVTSREEGTWHGAVGRQPTIIRQGARAKSREGLLNDFQAAEESTESSPTGDSPIGQVIGREIPSIQRATSVDIGKGHVRHISAGSARLLNLPARNSGESKRLSLASGERSPLGPPSPRPIQEFAASDVD